MEWLRGKTSIGGRAIPNWMLATKAVGLAIMAVGYILIIYGHITQH